MTWPMAVAKTGHCSGNLWQLHAEPFTFRLKGIYLSQVARCTLHGARLPVARQKNTSCAELSKHYQNVGLLSCGCDAR